MSTARIRTPSFGARKLLLPLIIAASFLAAACSSNDTSLPDSVYRLETPVALPDVTLVTTTAEARSLADFSGDNVTLLFLGYTNCPDICPTHMQQVGKAMNNLSEEDRRQVNVVFVTTDPERDTPDRIRDWLRLFDESATGLTGTLAEVNAVQRGLGMEATEPIELGDGSFAVNHATYVLAFDRSGEATFGLPAGMDQDDFDRAIRALIATG